MGLTRSGPKRSLKRRVCIMKMESNTLVEYGNKTHLGVVEGEINQHRLRSSEQSRQR